MACLQPFQVFSDEKIGEVSSEDRIPQLIRLNPLRIVDVIDTGRTSPGKDLPLRRTVSNPTQLEGLLFETSKDIDRARRRASINPQQVSQNNFFH